MTYFACRTTGKTNVAGEGDAHPFQRMNDLAVRVLLDLTASMRFPGSLNVDLNEISTNLVPFPSVHYLLSSVAPLVSDKRAAARSRTRGVSQLFADGLAPSSHLLSVDPSHEVYMACALLLRGKSLRMSDIRRNVELSREKMRFVPWNREGWKVGHCLVPPSRDVESSLLCLSNSSAMKTPLKKVRARYDQFMKRKAYLYHYEEYMDLEVFREVEESVDNVIEAYESVRRAYFSEQEQGDGSLALSAV